MSNRFRIALSVLLACGLVGAYHVVEQARLKKMRKERLRVATAKWEVLVDDIKRQIPLVERKHASRGLALRVLSQELYVVHGDKERWVGMIVFGVGEGHYCEAAIISDTDGWKAAAAEVWRGDERSTTSTLLRDKWFDDLIVACGIGDARL